MDSEIIVIGGGVSGLCAANYLSNMLGPESVLTLESGEAPGGTTGSDCSEGFVLDWGSNGFLDREPLTLAWAEMLGLSPKLVRANTAAAKRFIFRDERLHQIKPPPGFFLSPLLSLRGRLRLCLEPLVPPKSDDLPESVFDFAARRIGAEAAAMLVGAMVLGIYGGDARQLSMAHCFPRMVAMERAHGGLFKALMALRKERAASPMGPPGILTTFEGGLGTLPRRAAETLGNRLLYNATVTHIEKQGTHFTVHTNIGEMHSARAVVVATPAYAAAAMTRTLSAPLAEALEAIPYAGLAVVCLGYRRDAIAHALDGFGFLAPRGQNMRLLGCIWTSTLFPFQAPDDHVLLRVMLGGAPDPDALHLSDKELIALAQQELAPLLHLQGTPVLTRVFRHPRGIPQYTLDHEKHLTVIEATGQTHPGLFLTGNAYRGIGLNDCVVSARRVVEGVISHLGQ